MNDILNKMITHNFCINSIEEVKEDKSVLKFKAIVHDFNPSHNKWAITEDTAQKNIHTLLGKHIVTKYYSEDENMGVDALGNHEESSILLRGTNGEVELPSTNTRSIGTITNAWIAPLDSTNSLSNNVVWCEGILLVWDNINECSLLQEWSDNDIPILTSVEWYYSQSVIDSDGVEWIANPCYSNLCVLNSEKRGIKPIVYGNYDCSHIELVLNEEQYKSFNNAIKLDVDASIDIKENNKRSGEMENIFIKALNDISFGETRDKIYSALAKVMIAEEYNRLWISTWDVYDTYFIYETWLNDEWIRFKVDYSKNESDEIIVDFEGRKQVVKQDVFVEVGEAEKSVNSVKEELEGVQLQLNAANEKIVELEGTVLNEKESQIELTTTITSLNEKLGELQDIEKQLNEAKFEKSLNEAKVNYEAKFMRLNSVDVFESEEVQALIKDTLDLEKSLNAKMALADKLLDCVNTDTFEPKVEPVQISKSLNNLVPETINYVDRYGADV